MRMMIYVGPAASREQVIDYSAQLVQRVAASVSLVSGGGPERWPLLQEAAEQLDIPHGVPVTLVTMPGDHHQAVIAAAEEQQYDLIVFGRLTRPFGQLLPGPRSKAITQRLQPSVLRVHGQLGAIRRILVASGGDYHTFEDISVAARLAGPLGAEITLMHVAAQQSLMISGFGERRISVDEFLVSSAPEASTLRNAAAMLRQRGIATQVLGRSGPILDELLTELRSGVYDLLVVGAHRIANPLDRILLEDITGELLDVSPLPVLVVKGHES
ncbi:MAG: universal stress protein [Roseiflexaceae bacterium]|nr:universal stress protein [Roseiflexaceae bacterium]